MILKENLCEMPNCNGKAERLTRALKMCIDCYQNQYKS